ncbi:hypothetical protein HPB48_020237 [Haemaphysalis longicornis]|uniref:HAT C-terminal dimerisation domain-containing protein n=1 Tax=Haemaphysalis longicornis TaxID=44386 RepID=A0A9J6F702_HAELO|nr:hypothetical protein HPB48_020237 [Haemaphysalis longicornis]
MVRPRSHVWKHFNVCDSPTSGKKQQAFSTWWEGLCFNEPLNPIAGQILQIPPSSAACERNWSEFGNVHTKLRNRLSGDRVQKLVYVHSNLNVRKASSASQQRIDVASGTESDTD